MTAWREVTKRKRTWNEANYVLTEYDVGLAVIPSYNWNPNNISDYELRIATLAIQAAKTFTQSINSIPVTYKVMDYGWIYFQL